jgi:hypothetical protein
VEDVVRELKMIYNIVESMENMTKVKIRVRKDGQGV